MVAEDTQSSGQGGPAAQGSAADVAARTGNLASRLSSISQSTFTYNSNKTLSYLFAGPSDGPLLVFMHGWPAIARVWQPQISTFARLGFFVVAPDMPGYGKSSHDKDSYSSYSVQSVVTAMLALLNHVSRTSAIWIGHDAGCGPLWGLAAHHPTVCRAIVAMTVPYRTVECGLTELLKYVDRRMYPEDRYPYGQWSYQAFYQQSFEKATAWFEKDTRGVIKTLYTKGDPNNLTEPSEFTANVVQVGGWFGGIPQPPSEDMIPDELVIIDEETRKAVAESMENTGWWAANAFYMNEEANRKYMLVDAVNAGRLDMPVLFVEAQYDGVCATAISDLARPMKECTSDLTYVSIKSGHWVAEEEPEQVSAAIARWMVERVGDWWPKVDTRS